MENPIQRLNLASSEVKRQGSTVLLTFSGRGWDFVCLIWESLPRTIRPGVVKNGSFYRYGLRGEVVFVVPGAMSFLSCVKRPFVVTWVAYCAHTIMASEKALCVFAFEQTLRRFHGDKDSSESPAKWCKGTLCAALRCFNLLYTWMHIICLSR
jgi:hypothetical protein